LLADLIRFFTCMFNSSIFFPLTVFVNESGNILPGIVLDLFISEIITASLNLTGLMFLLSGFSGLIFLLSVLVTATTVLLVSLILFFSFFMANRLSLSSVLSYCSFNSLFCTRSFSISSILSCGYFSFGLYSKDLL